MDERFATLPSGIQICYESFGDPGDPAVLLIMGLGGPMNWWDAEFCRDLAAEGYYVIRFDNRDIGRSSSLDHAGRVSMRDVVRAYVRGAAARISAPYSLEAMAYDGVELLDCLGIVHTHVVGVSMGGMIAQTMAIRHPERVASLTSMMSNTGRRGVGTTSLKLIPSMLAPAPTDRDDYMRQSQRSVRSMGSPGYPEPPEVTYRRAAETWQRGLNPAGSARQLMAILTQPDRTEALQRLRVPTAVLHGGADLMIRPSGGLATSRAVSGSTFTRIDAMGHDLPRPLWPIFIDTISVNARRAAASACHGGDKLES